MAGKYDTPFHKLKLLLLTGWEWFTIQGKGVCVVYITIKTSTTSGKGVSVVSSAYSLSHGYFHSKIPL